MKLPTTAGVAVAAILNFGLDRINGVMECVLALELPLGNSALRYREQARVVAILDAFKAR